MVKKAHEQGGRRGQIRHSSEAMGASGILWVLLNRIEGLSSAESTALMGAGVVILGALAKAWSEYGLTAKLLGKLSLGGLVVTLGCAGLIGTSTPQGIDVGNGETIVAHTVEGVAWSFWDGGIGQNVEGGTGGQTTVGVLQGIVEAVGRVIAGMFTGLGGIGQGITEATTAPE